MFHVQGPTRAEVDAELVSFERLFHAAALRVMEHVSAELGHVRVAAAEPEPGEPAVSLDTLALIATLWVVQVQGLPEGGGEEEGNGSLGAALHAIYRRAVNTVRRAFLRNKEIPVSPEHPSQPGRSDISGVPPVPQVAPVPEERSDESGPSPSVEVDVPSIPDEDDDDLDVILDLPDDVAEIYLSQARNRMVNFSDDLWEVAREQLVEGFHEGESIEELRDRLVNVVGLTEKRATVVARTEVISASNAGSLAMVQYADFTGTKTWLATEDHRTRPTHVIAEGQTVGLEENFSVGGSSLQFPGDPSGAPEEVIQCRCTLTYTLDDDPSIVVASSHDEGSIAVEDNSPDVVTADGLIPEDGGYLESPMQSVLWEATLVVEDIPTGDGRMFATDSLSWAELPLSLLWQRKTEDGHGGSVVVGKITDIQRSGNQILGRGEFNAECDDAEEVMTLIQGEFLRGVSVDVDSINQADMEFVFPEGASQDEFAVPDLVVFHAGRIRGATLCAIPAFVEATIRLVQPEASEEMPMDDMEDAEYALTAAAVPAHSTATSDGPWDGGAQEKKLASPMTVAAAKGMYAWYDSSAVDGGEISKVDCRFPHHEVSADGTPGAANLKACSSGIAALHGARTPTTIPEADRRGVFNHLAKHLKDGGMTPPEFEAEPVTATGGIISPVDGLSLGIGERGPEAIIPINMKMSREIMENIQVLPVLTEENAHEVREFPGSMVSAAYVLTIPDVPPAWWFSEPTDVDMHGAFTVTDEGRVYGWLAPAGVAHRSFQNRVTVPMGNVDYSRFMGRETFVEGGGRVVSGALTMDCGHASTGYSDPDRAMDHYDNACSIVATVAIGERVGKNGGVWVAGAVVPGVTANQISRMMACQLSGDWRPHKEKSGWREFAGALLVPVPGFAMGRSQASVRMEEGQLVASAVPVRYAETPADCGCTVLQASVEEELSSGTVEIPSVDLSHVASFIARSIGRDVETRTRELASLVHGQEG